MAREERKPQLVEAVTYRFRGHSMADPEEYRTKEEVEEWRKRDPIETFRKRLVDEGVLSEDEYEELDERTVKIVDEAVEFADKSPFPDLDSLYDDIYVYGDQVQGWYSVDERSPDVHRGEEEREAGEVAHELAEAGAAYARGATPSERSRRQSRGADEQGRRRPRRGRRRRLMPAMRYREALNQALREEMEADEKVFIMGEDIGVFQGAFKVTAGPARGVRREARARHADLREHDRRHGRRRGDGRAAAGRRAHDDQLLAARARPDRQLRGVDPLHVRRPGDGADGDPHAAGRRAPARPDALALVRGAVPARARAARRGPVHARRTPRAC